MAEILNILFNPLPNAIMTLLTGLSLLYWLFTMLMGDGFDFGDANVDFDGADIQDIDNDIDLNGNTDTEPSFISKTLDFINIGKAPFMVILTLFKFIGWVITISSSLFFQLNQYGWKSIFILIPVFILTFLLMHYVTIPVVKLYNKLGYSGEESLELLGRTGLMKSSLKDGSLGSMELRIQNDVIRIYVKSRENDNIHYGDEVVIIDEDPDKKFYYVQKNITINNFNN